MDFAQNIKAIVAHIDAEIQKAAKATEVNGEVQLSFLSIPLDGRLMQDLELLTIVARMYRHAGWGVEITDKHFCLTVLACKS
jgi:hypothetical protein